MNSRKTYARHSVRGRLDRAVQPDGSVREHGPHGKVFLPPPKTRRDDGQVPSGPTPADPDSQAATEHWDDGAAR
jgi:hypothetical protein